MLLAAQSMAVGTVMVRWVSKYSDPVMATGWVNCISLYCHFSLAMALLVLLFETKAFQYYFIKFSNSR